MISWTRDQALRAEVKKRTWLYREPDPFFAGTNVMGV